MSAVYLQANDAGGVVRVDAVHRVSDRPYRPAQWRGGGKMVFQGSEAKALAGEISSHREWYEKTAARLSSEVVPACWYSVKFSQD